MKTIKHLALLAICMLATGLFTACNSDNDDPDVTVRPLTEAEQTLYKQTINGSYSGYLVYLQEDDITGDLVEKSEPATWNVNMTNSQLTITNFPLKALAAVTRNLDLKELLEKAEPVNLTANVSLLQQEYEQYILQGYYRYPVTPESMKFTVDGKNITINFWASMNYRGTVYESLAICYDKTFTLPVLIRDVQVDYNYYEFNELMYLTDGYTPKTTEEK